MAEQQQSRTLSKDEFEAIRQRVLAEAPPDLSEADFYRWSGPRMASAIAEAEHTPMASGPDARGGLRRFVGGAAGILNPVNMVEGTLDMIASPIDTTKQVWGAMGEQADKARDAFGQGRYIEAAGHGLASAVPVIGPSAAAAGERIGDGDIAGGLGEAVALGAVSSPSLIRGTANAARSVLPSGARESIAGSLERGAASRVTDVMRPEVGQNKVRFGNKADDIAPQLIEEGMAGGWSREGLHHRVQDRFVSAQRALDAAADARLAARTPSTAPILAALRERLKRLTAETVEATASTRTPTIRISEILDEQGKPIQIPGHKVEPFGQDVIPGPSQARAAEIQRAITEIESLGPAARYESIRRIRQAYDNDAKVKYNPSMTADYLKNQGKADGAADVTGVLREHLAKMDPATAAANAEYSLFRAADDVMRATAEVQRVRPKVGRAIMARVMGMFGGSQAAGVPGMAAGFVLGPAVESAVSSGFTTRLQTARLMAGLADAIRTGNMSRVSSISTRIKGLMARTAQIQGGASTNPSGSQLPMPITVR